MSAMCSVESSREPTRRPTQLANESVATVQHRLEPLGCVPRVTNTTDCVCQLAIEKNGPLELEAWSSALECAGAVTN